MLVLVESIDLLTHCFQSLKAKVEIAEREKLMLQKEMAKIGQDIRDKNDNNAMGLLGQGDNATQK